MVDKVMLSARSFLRAAPRRTLQVSGQNPLLDVRATRWRRYASDELPPSSNKRQNRLRDSRQDTSERASPRRETQSRSQGELGSGAALRKNTAPSTQSDTRTSNTPPGAQSGEGGFSRSQADGERGRIAGTGAVSSQSASQSTGHRPLPDLRQGLPSTFAGEFLNKTHTSSTEAGERNVNVVDDPREGNEGSADGAGRDPGELPQSAYQTSIDKRREAMMKWFYIAVAAMMASGAVYLGRNWETEDEEKAHPDAPSGWDLTHLWARIRARISNQMGYYTEPTFPKLLPEMDPAPPYTLVLSLEDMLVHSEWSREHGWRTAKRPGVDYFLGYLSQYYELVLFTTMPMAYADQITRKLDPYHFISWPLFREATRFEKGQYRKDLAYLNRPLSKTIIIDTDPEHVQSQPENAIILKPWKGDPKDRELVELIPYLEHIAAIGVPDVRGALRAFEGKHIPTEFTRRLAEQRAEFNKQLAAERANRPGNTLGAWLRDQIGIKPQGGMTYDGQTRVADELAKGKMLADQIRENGIRQYQKLEKEIRENGEKWLREEKEMEQRMMQEQMKGWQKSLFPFGGGGGSGGAVNPSPS